MSDTLQEREDQMGDERYDRIRSEGRNWLECCQGYTHAPWCSAYEETIPCQRCEGIATTTVNTRHFGIEKLCEPCAVNVRRDGQEVVAKHKSAARGEGDGPERIWIDCKPALVQGYRYIYLEPPDPDLLIQSNEYISANQHQSLVAERERLRVALRRLSITGRGALPVDEYRDWVKEVADEALGDQKGGPQ